MQNEMLMFVNGITKEESDKIRKYKDEIKIFFPNIKDNDIKYKKYEECVFKKTIENCINRLHEKIRNDLENESTSLIEIISNWWNSIPKCKKYIVKTIDSMNQGDNLSYFNEINTDIINKFINYNNDEINKISNDIQEEFYKKKKRIEISNNYQDLKKNL
jgi:hypothetical protein